MALRFGIEANKADLANLKKKIEELKKFPGAVHKVLKHSASQAVGRMKQQSPVDTGRLRREIEYNADQKGVVYIEAVAIDPETKKDYAPEQEYGGRYFPAQPFFYNNIRLMISKLFKEITISLSKLSK